MAAAAAAAGGGGFYTHLRAVKAEQYAYEEALNNNANEFYVRQSRANFTSASYDPATLAAQEALETKLSGRPREIRELLLGSNRTMIVNSQRRQALLASMRRMHELLNMQLENVDNIEEGQRLMERIQNEDNLRIAISHELIETFDAYEIGEFRVWYRNMLSVITDRIEMEMFVFEHGPAMMYPPMSPIHLKYVVFQNGREFFVGREIKAVIHGGQYSFWHEGYSASRLQRDGAARRRDTIVTLAASSSDKVSSQHSYAL